jgi:5-methylcytosine-specific restriction enzyme subunit McrC
MRVLTVCERDRVPISADDSGLAEVEAAELHRLEPFLPKGFLTWEHQAVRFGSHCGIMRVGELTVEILPKIRSDSEGDTRGVLVAMLRTAGFLASNPTTASVATQAQNLLDIFIIDFCQRVTELLRHGAIREYLAQEENITYVRGRLDLREHLRRNMLDGAHIHCIFDELTIDNEHNRLLKAALTIAVVTDTRLRGKGCS